MLEIHHPQLHLTYLTFSSYSDQEQGIKHVKTTLWKELMTTTIYFHIQVELDF